MGNIDNYQKIIETIFIEYTKIPYAYGEIHTEAVFDRTNNRYLLINVGWEDDGRRVHGCLIHIDIINDKLWIQRDGTEHGIAKELTKFGVPKESIVLAFQPLEIRQYTEYAAA